MTNNTKGTLLNTIFAFFAMFSLVFTVYGTRMNSWKYGFLSSDYSILACVYNIRRLGEK